MNLYVPISLWERGQTFKIVKFGFTIEAKANEVVVTCKSQSLKMNLPSDAEFFEVSLLLDQANSKATVLLLTAKGNDIRITDAQNCQSSQTRGKDKIVQIGDPEKLLLISDIPVSHISLARFIAQRQAVQRGIVLLPPELLIAFDNFFVKELNLNLTIDDSHHTYLVPPIVLKRRLDQYTTRYIYSGFQVIIDKQHKTIKAYYFDKGGVRTATLTDDEFFSIIGSSRYSLPIDLRNDPDALEMYLTTGFLPYLTSDTLKQLDANQLKNAFCQAVIQSSKRHSASNNEIG